MRRKNLGRVKSYAEISKDGRKYRLRQFYAILLKADKARLIALRERAKSDKFEEQNKADYV